MINARYWVALGFEGDDIFDQPDPEISTRKNQVAVGLDPAPVARNNVAIICHGLRMADDGLVVLEMYLATGRCAVNILPAGTADLITCKLIEELPCTNGGILGMESRAVDQKGS